MKIAIPSFFAALLVLVVSFAANAGTRAADFPQFTKEFCTGHLSVGYSLVMYSDPGEVGGWVHFASSKDCARAAKKLVKAWQSGSDVSFCGCGPRSGGVEFGIECLDIMTGVRPLIMIPFEDPTNYTSLKECKANLPQ